MATAGRLEMTIRVMAFIKALQTWQTLPDLCDQIDATERTVLRYLAAAQMAHLPLEIEREKRNERARYRLR